MVKGELFGKAVSWAVAGIVGALFVYASVSKIADPAGFALDVKHYRILPLQVVNGVALFLPWWELSAGLALFIPSWRRTGAAIVFALSCVFAVAVISAIARGLDISCGCFGSGSQTAGLRTLAVDFGLMLAAGLLLWSRFGRCEPLDRELAPGGGYESSQVTSED